MAPTNREVLRNLMAEGKIEDVLQGIRTLVENDKELDDQWILIKSRWENNEREKSHGTIDKDDYNELKNDLSKSLLNFIDEVTDKHDIPVLYKSKTSSVFDLDKHFLITSYLKKSPAEIWSDFVIDFKSYNDSWLMEDDDYEAFVETHKIRYNDPKCGKFNFLFFPKEGNHSSWKPFIRFAKFQAFVHFDINPIQESETKYKDMLKQKLNNPSPKTLKHISVYLNMKEEPQQTFFRGYKYNSNGEKEKISIWYLKLNNHDEKPELILKTTNDEFWKDLNDKWNKSKRKLTPLKGKKIFEKLLKLLDEPNE